MVEAMTSVFGAIMAVVEMWIHGNGVDVLLYRVELHHMQVQLVYVLDVMLHHLAPVLEILRGVGFAAVYLVCWARLFATEGWPVF